ncbi:MAG: polymer-forming cytoskeletal protein [Anaerolineae bacterium]|nr:polymer-forming cytoskeletal protein [Anaerolineae bacterium]
MSFWGGRKQQQPPSQPGTPTPAPTASRQPVGFETVLGASATLKGDLKSQGNVRLDGTFEGTLEIDGNVLIGETAKITANIHAKNVSIAGAVRGDVSGKKVEILRTGRVWGDITATAISTEEGCFIEDKITMITHEAAQPFDQPAFAAPIPNDTAASAAPSEPALPAAGNADNAAE